jgi:hypothetical protein
MLVYYIVGVIDGSSHCNLLVICHVDDGVGSLCC